MRKITTFDSEQPKKQSENQKSMAITYALLLEFKWLVDTLFAEVTLNTISYEEFSASNVGRNHFIFDGPF